jgi:hypothetical protein
VPTTIRDLQAVGTTSAVAVEGRAGPRGQRVGVEYGLAGRGIGSVMTNNTNSPGPASDKEAHVTREPFSDADEKLLAELDAVDVTEGEHSITAQQAAPEA